MEKLQASNGDKNTPLEKKESEKPLEAQIRDFLSTAITKEEVQARYVQLDRKLTITSMASLFEQILDSQYNNSVPRRAANYIKERVITSKFLDKYFERISTGVRPQYVMKSVYKRDRGEKLRTDDIENIEQRGKFTPALLEIVEKTNQPILAIDIMKLLEDSVFNDKTIEDVRHILKALEKQGELTIYKITPRLSLYIPIKITFIPEDNKALLEKYKQDFKTRSRLAAENRAAEKLKNWRTKALNTVNEYLATLGDTEKTTTDTIFTYLSSKGFGSPHTIRNKISRKELCEFSEKIVPQN